MGGVNISFFAPYYYFISLSNFYTTPYKSSVVFFSIIFLILFLIFMKLNIFINF